MQCMTVNGRLSDELMSVEIRNDGRYLCTCREGHTTLSTLQQQKFEVLSSVAGGALLDGYPREGITSMAAALERLYEYVVTVIGIELQVPQETFQAAWKPIGKLSERQFGAYVIAYTIAMKAIAPTIADKKPTIPGQPASQTPNWTEFRNSVVHNGYLPSTSEAMAYAALVFDHMRALIAIMTQTFPKAAYTALCRHIARVESVGTVSTMSIPTLVSLHDDGKMSFEERLNDLKKWFR